MLDNLNQKITIKMCIRLSTTAVYNTAQNGSDHLPSYCWNGMACQSPKSLQLVEGRYNHITLITLNYML